jgi:hypothetical protein
MLSADILIGRMGERGLMPRRTIAATVFGVVLMLAPAASAHNRAHIVLPTGECIVVGSEKSVTLPDGTLLDLRPETQPADEIGTAFAADEGNSALEKGPCP